MVELGVYTVVFYVFLATDTQTGQTVMCARLITPLSLVLLQRLLELGCLASDVDVLTANHLDQLCCSLGTDAFAISYSGLLHNLFIPVLMLQMYDRPVVFRAPRKWLARCLVS